MFINQICFGIYDIYMQRVIDLKSNNFSVLDEFPYSLNRRIESANFCFSDFSDFQKMCVTISKLEMFIKFDFHEHFCSPFHRFFKFHEHLMVSMNILPKIWGYKMPFCIPCWSDTPWIHVILDNEQKYICNKCGYIYNQDQYDFLFDFRPNISESDLNGGNYWIHHAMSQYLSNFLLIILFFHLPGIHFWRKSITKRNKL